MAEAGCLEDSVCGSFAFCNTDSTCVCFSGYVQQRDKSCISAVAYEPAFALSAQIIVAIVFGLITIFGIATIIIFFRAKKTSSYLNISYVLSVIITVDAFVYCILYSVDPFGINLIPEPLRDSLYAIVLHAPITVFLFIVTHLVELYNSVVSTIQKEQMLRKINSSYQGEHVTVEDLQDRLHIMRKGRIPFAVVLSSAVILYAAATTCAALKKGFIGRMIYLVWGVYLACIYLGIILSFVFVAREFSKVLPTRLKPRVRKTATRVAYFTVLAAIFEGIGLGMPLVITHPRAYLAGAFASSIVWAAISSLLLLSVLWVNDLLPCFPIRDDRRRSSDSTAPNSFATTATSMNSFSTTSPLSSATPSTSTMPAL